MSDMMKSIGMDAAQVGWINDPADWLDTNIQQVMVIFMSCCIYRVTNHVMICMTQLSYLR